MLNVVVTQAAGEVGFGHLMECLALVSHLPGGEDARFLLYKSSEQAVSLVREHGFECAFWESGAPLPRFDWGLMNTRNNNVAMQSALRRACGKLIVIDELGNKEMDCDLLINFAAPAQWHEYTFKEPAPRMLLGPKYYPVRDSLLRAAQKTDTVPGTVLVTLGGVDRTQRTLDVARKLIRTDLCCTYVLGPGCEILEKDLKEILRSAPHKDEVVINPDNFDSLFAASEYVISAGGNTLYEGLFLGSRLLVVWEDEHERVQSAQLEEWGCAQIIGSPDFLDFSEAFDFHPDSCTSPCDGRGVERIQAVVKEMVAHG